MLATRWEPLAERNLNRFEHEVNRLFNHFATAGIASPHLAQAFPPVNIWEDGDNVYAEAELPGMQENQLDIYVSDQNQLTIQGERQWNETQKGTWHRQERGFGKFVRVLTLPSPVNADAVEARLENGVLFLKLAKSQAAKPRKIAVKAQ